MELPYKKITFSPEETEKLGESLADALCADSSLPRFVAMYGDLGVGKTAFVRGFTRVFAPEALVRSPTFALVNEYGPKTAPVYHFDMYRIADEDDLYSTGFYDYLSGRGYCIVEWSENIPYALPDRYIRVDIKKISPERPDERDICITQEG